MFAVAITEGYCCEDCACRRMSKGAEEIYGPFGSVEEAQIFLQSKGFGRYNTLQAETCDEAWEGGCGDIAVIRKLEPG